jgi:uncharacterized membrane protein
MMGTFISDLSGKEFPLSEKVTGKLIRPSLMIGIQQEHPDFTESKCLSILELNEYREKYISRYLTSEVGELTKLDQRVLKSLADQNTLTDKVDADDNSKLSVGQRVADKVATFGGSWTFIISFGVFLVSWITLNVVFLASKAFDPFPFILLNLILSCIAAMQAPVIMMSQNRQEEKDRERARKDYMINLKSEVEIRMLHEKIDHMIMHQQQELIEIQKLQIDMMKDILAQVEKSQKNS